MAANEEFPRSCIAVVSVSGPTPTPTLVIPGVAGIEHVIESVDLTGWVASPTGALVPTIAPVTIQSTSLGILTIINAGVPGTTAANVMSTFSDTWPGILAGGVGNAVTITANLPQQGNATIKVIWHHI